MDILLYKTQHYNVIYKLLYGDKAAIGFVAAYSLCLWPLASHTFVIEPLPNLDICEGAGPVKHSSCLSIGIWMVFVAFELFV